MKNVAITGQMHSGKGELAKRLVDRYGYSRKSFAEPVKEAAVVMMNALLRHLELPPSFSRDELEANKTELRSFLQVIGTELGREYIGPYNVWIIELINGIDQERGPFVIDDMRFPNEADFMRERGWLIVRVDRPAADRIASIRDRLTWSSFPPDRKEDVDDRLNQAMSHPSERGVTEIVPDLVIENDSLESLDAAADLIASL